jgi:hypothetical protein
MARLTMLRRYMGLLMRLRLAWGSMAVVDGAMIADSMAVADGVVAVGNN